MDNCTLDCILVHGKLNYTEMCYYAQGQCHQGMIQFVQGYYCIFNGSFMLLTLVGIPLTILLFKTLNVIAQEYLSPCVEVFIDEFKISPTIAGVTFLAFANGAPDVMTAIIAGSSDSAATALIPFGSIFGAFLFSAAFILSQVILKQKNQHVRMKMRQFVLPLVFYIVSITFILCVALFYKKMNVYIAGTLLIVYVIYIIFVVKTDTHAKEMKQGLLNAENSEFTASSGKTNTNLSDSAESPIKHQHKKPKESIFTIINNAVEKAENAMFQFLIPFYKAEQWNPLKAVITLIVSPVILAMTQKIPHIFTAFVGPVPVMVLISIPAILLLIYVIYCIVRSQPPYFIKVFTIYSFIVSVCALTIVCFILINFVELVQLLTGMNPVFLGLTVFALANSVGGTSSIIVDYLTIIHFAKKGNAKTAVAAIFSGQLFNFLLGFGVSLLIQSLGAEGLEYDYSLFKFDGTTYDKISDAIVMFVIAAGLIYLVLLLVMGLKNKGLLQHKEAMIGRWSYIIFLLIAIALAVLTDFFNQIDCHHHPFLVDLPDL